MIKILVTGSNGLLGQKLTRQIMEDPALDLLATSRGPNRNSELADTHYHELDLTNDQQVGSVIENYRPDVIINTAAMTNVDQCETEKEGCWELNVGVVERLVKYCDQYQSRLVHLSTDFIFDGEDGPYSEDAEANPVSYYGESKLAGERLIMESAIDWAIIRTVLVYGIVEDMSRSNIILWVKSSLEAGKQLKIVNDQWRTPTLAEDLATGCLLVVKQEAKGVFNISGSDLLTPYDMAIMTANFFELDKGLIEKADASTFSQAAKRPPKTGFILDKARKELGYNPHSFEEGIAILASQLNKITG